MKVLWSIALVATGLLFCACGDGAVEAKNNDDELALLNYGEFNPEGMKGLVSDAMAKCEEEPACKQAMENSKDIPRPDVDPGSSSADSSAAPKDSSKTGPEGESSSSSSTPASSQQAAESSSAMQPDSPVSSSEAAASSSSQSKTITPTQFIGSCTATSVVKGSPTTWKFVPITYCTLPSNCSLLPESYEWTFTNGDIETSTDAEPQVVYANKGSYTASVKLTNGEVEQTVECTSIEIVGPEITGCTCGEATYTPASADLKDAATVSASWEISDCSSIDGLGNEQELSYSWSGSGVTNSGTSNGTGSYTELGNYTATVTVSNNDGNSTKVTCNATVIDNTPFRCNADNSTALTSGGGDNNHADVNVSANQCYSYQMDKCTRNYAANMQIGSWNGVSDMYFVDCKGEKGKAKTGANDFAAVNMNYQNGQSCTVYFYMTSSVNGIQINMW